MHVLRQVGPVCVLNYACKMFLSFPIISFSNSLISTIGLDISVFSLGNNFFRLAKIPDLLHITTSLSYTFSGLETRSYDSTIFATFNILCKFLLVML